MHPGNMLYNRLLKAHYDEYKSARKGAKGSFAEKMVLMARAQGVRFLEVQERGNDDDNNSWVVYKDIGDERATEKTVRVCARERFLFFDFWIMLLGTDIRIVCMRSFFFSLVISSCEFFPFCHSIRQAQAFRDVKRLTFLQQERKNENENNSSSSSSSSSSSEKESTGESKRNEECAEESNRNEDDISDTETEDSFPMHVGSDNCGARKIYKGASG